MDNQEGNGLKLEIHLLHKDYLGGPLWLLANETCLQPQDLSTYKDRLFLIKVSKWVEHNTSCCEPQIVNK